VVVGGLVGIALVIALVAWRSMRWTLDGRLGAGVAALGPAGIAGFAAAMLLGGPVAALTVPTGATLVGFALALASGGGDRGSGSGPEDDPPWWPSFERGLRQYERTRSPAGRR
jgi:hypothetical protein